MTPSASEPYHHGNLREALLNAAVEALRTEGAQGLSLRALARDLGVSQAAPYRHFPDKEALLAELATQGFHELTRRMETALNGRRSTPLDAHRGIGVAYVMFAFKHPEQYRLMFGAQRLEAGRHPEFSAAAAAAFEVLRGTVQKGIEAGAFRQAPVEVQSLAAWSLVHGLAFLAMDGLLPAKGPKAVQALAEQVISAFLEGVRAV